MEQAGVDLKKGTELIEMVGESGIWVTGSRPRQN